MTKPKTPEPTEPLAPAFELIVGEANGEIINADIPVRWCVTPNLVKQMEDAGIIDPHVLILTATSSGQEIQRQVVPIGDLMTYARFSKAGDMRLYGWIVDGKMGRKELHKTLTRKSKGKHETDLIDTWDGTPYKDLGDLSFAHTGMNIEIPAGVFGKEPSPWVKWFSNLWHEDRTVDQCHFRRRMIFAFTLKWIPVLAFAIISVAARSVTALIFYSIGYRQSVSNPEYIFKPFYTDYDDTFTLPDLEKQNFLFRRKTKYIHSYFQQPIEQTHTLLLPFTPIIPMLIVFLSWLVTESWASVGLLTMGWMLFFLSITAVIDMVCAVMIYSNHTSAISKVIDFVISKTINNWNRLDTYMVDNKRWPITILITALVFLGYIGTFVIAHWQLFAIVIGALVVMSLLFIGIMWIFNRFTLGDTEAADYTEIRELLCPKDEENKIASYSAIPKEQRSIRLWYLDMKNKVCKPMQL